MVDELGARILGALWDRERSGASQMLEAQQLADRFHVDLHSVLSELDMLEGQGAVEVYRVGGGGGGTSARIMGRGKTMLQEWQKTASQESDKSKAGRGSEALKLLDEVASELCGKYDLLGCLRKYLMALRYLGWDDKLDYLGVEWVSR